MKNLPTIERSTRLRYGKNCLEDQAENTIVFNASNTNIDASNPGALYLSPIRNRPDYEDPEIVLLMYNRGTKEITESGEAATDIIETTLQGATLRGNVTANTSVFTGVDLGVKLSILTANSIGVANLTPTGDYTLSVGSSVFIDDEGNLANVLTVIGDTDLRGDVVIDGNLHVQGLTTVIHVNNTLIKDPLIELGRSNDTYNDTLDLGVLMHRPDGYSNVAVAFNEETRDMMLTYTSSASTDSVIIPKTDENINVHVYGQLFTEANVGIVNTNPIHTLDVGSNLYIDDLSTNVLVVDGSVDLSNVLTIGDNTHIGNELHVENNTFMSRDLSVSGNTFVTGNVIVSDQLIVSKNVYLSKDIEITGNAYTTGSSNINFQLIVGNDIYGFRELNIAANSHLYKDVLVTGNTYIGGNIVAQNDLTLSGNAYIAGNVVASKDLTLSGNAYVSGNVEVTKSLIVSDNTHLKGDNVFITHTMDFLDPTTAIVTDQVSNVQIRLGQLENVSNLASNPLINQVLRYSGNQWSNDYPQQNFTRVKNGYSEAEDRTLYKGNTVYVSATQNAGLVQVRAAQSHIASQMPCIGIVYEDIGPELEGLVLTYGIIDNLNTKHLTAGGTVYVSNVYSGYHTSVKPDDDVSASPDLIQNLGICTRSHESSGAIFVTGIGRANDIPNAQLVTSNSYTSDLKYVYVNYENNDLRKIDPMKLSTKLQPLSHVVNTGNVVANAISVTGLHVTDGGHVISTGNVQAGASISIGGLNDKYLPYVSANKYLKESVIRQETDGRIVISADLEVDGAITVAGGSFEVTSGELIITDRIIDIANGAVTHDLDTGILIEHPGHNIGLIHHGDEDRFSMGYTQNGFSDTHILEDSNIFTLDVIGNVLVQNTITIENGDLIVGVGNAYFEGNVSVVGDTIVSGNIHIESNLNVAGNVYIEGNTVMDGNLLAASLTLTRGPLKIGDLFNAGPGEVPGVGSVVINGVVQSLAFRTAHDSGYNTGIANTAPANTLSIGANAYINAYGTTILSITGNTVTTNLFARSNIGVNLPTGEPPGYSLDVRGTSNVATLNIDRSTAATSKTSGALTVAGGVGIEGDIYATGGTFSGGVSADTFTGAVSGTTGTFSGALKVDTDTLVVDVANDRVGINKAAPTVALDVSGDGTFSGDVSGVKGTFSGDVSGVKGTFTGAVSGTTGTFSGALKVDTDTLVVDVVNDRVGINKAAPTVALDVSGAGTFSGALKGGSLYTTDYIYHNDDTNTNIRFPANDTISLTTNNSERLRVTSAGNVGIGKTNPSYKLHVNGTVNTGDLTATTVTVPNDGDFIMNSKPLVPATGLHWDRVNNRFGVGTSSPSTKLHVVGGTITNSDAVAKKTYSYAGDLPGGTTIANATIKITFSAHIFSARIVAHLIEGNNEISTMSVECCGGHRTGGTGLNITTGSVSIFGNTNTNPWSPLITTTTNTIVIKPSTNIDAAVTGHYNIFIEYFSSNSAGVVSKITEGSTDVATFGY